MSVIDRSSTILERKSDAKDKGISMIESKFDKETSQKHRNRRRSSFAAIALRNGAPRPSSFSCSLSTSKYCMVI